MAGRWALVDSDGNVRTAEESNRRGLLSGGLDGYLLKVGGGDEFSVAWVDDEITRVELNPYGDRHLAIEELRTSRTADGKVANAVRVRGGGGLIIDSLCVYREGESDGRPIAKLTVQWVNAIRLSLSFVLLKAPPVCATVTTREEVFRFVREVNQILGPQAGIFFCAKNITCPELQWSPVARGGSKLSSRGSLHDRLMEEHQDPSAKLTAFFVKDVYSPNAEGEVRGVGSGRRVIVEETYGKSILLAHELCHCLATGSDRDHVSGTSSNLMSPYPPHGTLIHKDQMVTFRQKARSL